MYLASYNCLGTKFDIFDSENVRLMEDKNDYFITPERLIQIEKWLIESDKPKIITSEDLQHVIAQGWLTRYA